MRLVIRCFIILIAFSIIGCEPHKVCSGLNPEIGKYNTSKKIRRGKRHLHSGPEKEAYRRRAKQMQKRRRKKRGGKAVPVRHGIFIHIGVKSRTAGGRFSGNIGNDGNSNKQKN
jgi:hypothetical protein